MVFAQLLKVKFVKSGKVGGLVVVMSGIQIDSGRNPCKINRGARLDPLFNTISILIG
jgi:hypothetical protein